MIDATAVEHPPASSPQVELKLVLVPCPLCGEDEAEPVAVGSDLAHGTTSDSFLAVRCGGCELVYLRPRPAAEERLRLYPPSYFSPSDARSRPERRRAHAVARRMVRACPSPPPNARLLEVGYGARLHLGELRRCGPRTWVLEVVTPHETLARAGRSEGFIVYPGRGRALEDRGAIYDVVFLLHALEHCESPLEELKSLRRLIRPGGRLILLTENADSAVGRVFRGRHWAGYDFPRHLIIDGTTHAPPTGGRNRLRSRATGHSQEFADVGSIDHQSPPGLECPFVADSSRAARRTAARRPRLTCRERGPVSSTGCATAGRSAKAGRHRPMSREKSHVAVVGAGLAGLLAARELRRRGISVTVFESGRQVAGLARSFTDQDGFTYDFGAHFITNRLAAALGIGAQCRDVHYYGESVVLEGQVYSYPFGLIRSPRFLSSAIAARLVGRSDPAPRSAAEWYRREYGSVLADAVAIPLVEAWSGAPAIDLAPSVIPPQVDRGTAHVLKLRLASRLSGRAVANGYSREKPESPHVWHVYPTGSVGLLCEQLAAGLGRGHSP